MKPQLPRRPNGTLGASSEGGGNVVGPGVSDARIDDQTAKSKTSLHASAADGPNEQAPREGGGGRGNGSCQPVRGGGENGGGGVEGGKKPTEPGKEGEKALDETAVSGLVRTLTLSNFSDRPAVLEVSWNTFVARWCLGRHLWAHDVRAIHLTGAEALRGAFLLRGKSLT